MEEFFVYHVVTERNLLSGQTIVFDENNHNGVYNRVNACFDYINGRDVEEGLKKLVSSNLDNWKKVAYRERALERVRQKEFADYPSRMACLYVSKSFEEALSWAEFFAQIGRPTYNIVKLQIDGNCFMGDAEKCFKGQLSKEQNLILAEEYWKKPFDSSKQGICEMLVDGKITVLESVREINANLDKQM